jgi:hypothetical protein
MSSTIGRCWFLATLLLIGLAGCNGMTEPEAIAGKPLLQGGNELFRDEQTGLQFMPPGNWSMQMRSGEAPGLRLAERGLVKYRRVIEGLDPAWMKVTVIYPREEIALGDLLRARKLNPGWKIATPVEKIKLKDYEAARLDLAGPMTTDDGVSRDFVTELTAVRHGDRVFLFAGTFTAADPKGRKRIRAALETVEFF